MTELQLLGLGIWSPSFANWQEFRAGLAGGDWPGQGKLAPERIPARERRRAPQLVRMAIEVMDQACSMASLEPDDVAVVFSSAMGDMDITDYMCRTLADDPAIVSPTRFHNSVHNAAPGYWSITTGAFSPATAVSAFEYTAPTALLEGAIQAAEESTPVLIVTQEVAAPDTLMDICPTEVPFAAALLVAPPGFSTSPVATISVAAGRERVDWPVLDERVPAQFASNMSATLLPLLTSLARGEAAGMKLPLSQNLSLSVKLEGPHNG